MKQTLFAFGVAAASAFYVIFTNQNASSAFPLANGTTTVQTGAPIAAGGTTPPAQQTPAPAAAATPAQSTPAAKPAKPSSPAATPAPKPAPTPAPVPAPKPAGQYADGTYTGTPGDAYYGMVQVQAVIQGGQLANVNILQYPNTHSTSIYINQQALPYLIQEAIQVQNANVNIVSGATDTSMAFQQSLASALGQAKN